MGKKVKLWIFFVLFIFSLYTILFVRIDNNKETGKNQLVLFDVDGYKKFKKGLDVAGGVRLTYKVDLSKYQQIYTDIAEYNMIKNRVIDIIKTNIDTRISKLGVSDYNAYLQTLDDIDYIVVEIGGLKDVQEGKNVIGKTVELEFKLPFDSLDSKEIVEERKTLTQDLFTSLKQTPQLFGEMVDDRVISENIYYNNFKDIKSYELPESYKTIVERFNGLSEGTIVDEIFEGQYNLIYLLQGMDQSEFGFIQQSFENIYENLDGRIITKFNGMKEEKATQIEEVKFTQVMENNGIEYEIQTLDNDMGMKEQKYQIGEDLEFRYLSSNLYSGENAYETEIYSIAKNSLISVTGEDKDNIDLEHQKIIDDLKSLLSNNEAIVNLSGVQQLHKGWIGNDDIRNYSLTFTEGNKGDVLVLNEANETLVMKIINKKLAQDNLYRFIVGKISSNDIKQKIENELSTEILYSFEDVFIAKQPKWLIAKDPETNEILNGAFFQYAGVSQGQTGTPVVNINFNDKGKEIFCNITTKYTGKNLAIFVGGSLVTNATIQEKICGGGAVISGGFTAVQAKDMAKNLNEGALPAKLIPAHEEKISPTLGESAFKGAIYATLLGLLFIFIYMSVMYGLKMGTISLFALIIFLTVLLAVIKLFGYTFSLSGIAAILLSLGMGVDSNILIFERVKEELKTGKSYGKSIIDGYEKSRSAIRDGNFTTIMIGLLLLFIATNVFKGFGTMLTINIILTLSIIVPFTKEMLLLFFEKK